MAVALERGQYWSVQDIMALFKVSRATAKRDLIALKTMWPMRRELRGPQREVLYFRADKPRLP